ncbi:MAG: hypothetical protein ACE5G8_05545, partial [Anaerolineae bacterium]
MRLNFWAGQRGSPAVALGLTIAAGLSVWLAAPYPVRLAAAALLVFVLPGWLLFRAIGLRFDDGPEEAGLVFGASLG